MTSYFIGITYHMAIFLEKRKNDQFREGSWFFVAALHSK